MGIRRFTREELEPFRRLYHDEVHGYGKDEDFAEWHGYLMKNGCVLTAVDLVEIGGWKSDRRVDLLKVNPDGIVRAVTRLAFELASEDYSLGVLCALDGVDYRMASAFMTLREPTRFGVLDQFAWKALFGKEPSYYGDKQWSAYIAEVQRLAKEFDWTPREVDKALLMWGKCGGRSPSASPSS